MMATSAFVEGSPEAEETVLRAIQTGPSNTEDILRMCYVLQSPRETALSQLDSSWEVLWSDLGLSSAPVSLEMLSFGALCGCRVELHSSYNIVDGSRYDLLQAFSVPGSALRAAMVLCGHCARDPAQPHRLVVEFRSVRIAPCSANPEACEAALVGCGLGAAVRAPVPIQVRPAFIDIEYISPCLRVHKGQSGTTYVLQRLASADAIPFVLG